MNSLKKLLLIAASLVLAVTAPAQSVNALSTEEKASLDANWKIVVDYSDVVGTSGSSASNLNVPIFPPVGQFASNQIVTGVIVRIDTPFYSTGDTNLNGFLTMSLGDVASATRFMGALAVASNNAVDVFVTNANYRYITGSNLIARFSATGAAGATGGALNNLTNGQATIFLKTVNLDSLR